MMRTPVSAMPKKFDHPGKTHKRSMRHAAVGKSPSEPEFTPGLNG